MNKNDRIKIVIEKVYKENDVSVVMAFNDDFVFPSSTMIRSIIDNSDNNTNYDIVILHRDITELHQSKIEGMVLNMSNFSIRFFDIGDYSKKYTCISHIDMKELYFRLMIPELFINYEKVLFLDGDMIALCDIGKLYFKNIDDYLFAGVKDICGIWRYYDKSSDHKYYLEKILGLNFPENYINAGMLLINLKKYREIYNFNDIWKYVDPNNNWKYHDQDIINKIGDGNTLILPYKWNMVRECPQKAFELLPKEDAEKWKAVAEGECIIHYAGPNKPWFGIQVPRYEEFWKYAIKTPIFMEELFTSQESLEAKTNALIEKRKYSIRKLFFSLCFGMKVYFKYKFKRLNK